MIKPIIIAIFLLSAVILGGQHSPNLDIKQIDSLKQLLPRSDHTQQVDLLNQLASAYAPVNSDSSIAYSAQAMRMATIQGYSHGIGCSRLYTGNAYYYKMDLKNALLSYLGALKILEDDKPSKELGELYLQLGNINYYIGRTENAISFYRLAKQTFRATGNVRGALQIDYAMMFTYLMGHHLDSALLHGEVFLDACANLNDRYLRAHGLNVVGWIYSEMKDPEMRKKALECCNESLEIGKEMNDKTLIAVNYLNLGNNFDRGGWEFEGAVVDLPLARSYHRKAFLAAQQADLHLLMGAISNYLAAIDIEEGKFKQAEANLQLSKCHLDTAIMSPYGHLPVGPFYSFGKMVDYILAQQHRAYLYDLHFRLEMAKGETDNAIDYLHLFYQYSDSIYAAQQARHFSLIMAEAEEEKTQQKITNLAQENELNKLRAYRSRYIASAVAAAVAIFSLFALLYFQRKRYRAEQKSILMEQRLLRAQMNPHFLFNSLASIQNYIINEKTDQASTYLSRFSQLVRNILDNSSEEYVPVEKEIETVRYYLELQKVRYAGKFDFRIEIDDRIDQEGTMIPPMLAQPFIENAIEHGIRHRQTPGHLDIRFTLEDGLIRFEMEDDGVGRERANEIEAGRGMKHRSMSTSMTHDRLMLINRKLKKKIRMEITDLKDGDGVGIGTRVSFGIPIQSVEC